MIDSHCHLEMVDFDLDLPLVFEAMEANDVTHAVSIGSLAQNERIEKTFDIISQKDNIFTTLGVHPKSPDESFLTIEKLFEKYYLEHKNKIVAVGETGLDYFQKDTVVLDKDKQRNLFKLQIELALSHKLPIIVHIRDAYEDAYDILKSYINSPTSFYGGVIHCFSANNFEIAADFLNLGFFISFSGNITYKKNSDLRNIAKKIPDEKLLIETDSPYLAPQKFRGKRNEPSYVRFVAQTIAEEKNIDLEKFKELTVQNTVNAFSLYTVSGFYPSVAYKIGASVYVNITNKCTNKCSFCPKYQDGKVNYNVRGYNLELRKEPDDREVISSVFHYYNFKEVVFCGLGEPTLKIDILKKAAKVLKTKGIRVRLDTDGLANVVYGYNAAKELGEFIDSVSISLNAHNSSYYNEICRPQIKKNNIDPFNSILEFIEESKKSIKEVVVTAVDLKGLDVNYTKKIAAALGAKFKLRQYNDVG
jgi:TatD DNase family protein